jgi:CNT family concentrative nucleoside transporter
MERVVSLVGVFAILAICFVFSRNRRAISWRLVGVGLLLQAALGFTFLYWTAGNEALQAFGQKVDSFLKLAHGGTEFVFGALASPQSVGAAFGAQKGFLFAFMVLPTLIFFSSFMAVLYHLGVMQWVVRGMASVMVRVLGTSGSESLSGCANVFVGQTGVTASTGFPIPPGAILEARIGAAVDVFMIASAGSQNIRTLQLS